MSRYEFILFDADETLLDFLMTEEVALQKTFSDYGLVLDEKTNVLYQRINQGLWREFEQGKIEKEVVTSTRFQRLFDQLSIDKDGKAFSEVYQENLGLGFFLIPGAQEICQQLSQCCKMYFVTNGVSKTQYSRIAGSGLQPYFLDTFVSEDTGYQKPMKGYFDYVFARIPQFDRSKAIIIGDSLSSDIQGGRDAGIDTCWFNPKGKTNSTIIQPTYEIQQLWQLEAIVKGE